jgi:hypothetical protein
MAVARQKWSRGQVETQFANMPACPIGMEVLSANEIAGALISMMARSNEPHGEVGYI